ncbi:Integrin_alpha2 domain-containing protein [Meloidogyne graminicola]|uniref:phosphoinositide 5-phosphatase n=1 Tax=Meloidogyne graminicola TaxID=189291 RepID=A0A8S9ZSM3_9BILA|nr:Integrin_alpha2 domain-containing protein [Meloidogyne graminicola]
MALRSIRVYAQNLGNYSVLLEATNNEKFLLCQSGGLDSITKELACLLKSSGYQLVLDGFASLGILQLGGDDDYLVLITGVLSVGQIYNSDIFKISNVKFVSLIRKENEPSDQRIIEIMLISRLSFEHVGTRFNVRGINDDGNVANFVETEQIVIFDKQECSFLQIRGSIPLFWEQPGINVGAHTVKLRPLELSLFALEKRQGGVIRTNCLDNLDRTNSVQTLIGMRALFSQLTCLGVEKIKSNIIVRCEELVKDMWQKNGDQCSIIYAGTGALEGKSKLRDASRSIVRTIQNNLMDSSKQESFDLILFGRLLTNSNFVKISQIFPSSFLKASSYFFECPNLEAFVERENDLCVPIPLKIFCGTWNVNGGKNLNNVAFKGGNLLSSWIFPTNLSGQNEIVARNNDFNSAVKRMRFPMGRTLLDHDVIFWLGDFNYRISLSADEVKKAINLNNFALISEYDQLLQQKNLGNIFFKFLEGQLNFLPTYKYDTFSDDYDTSDKCSLLIGAPHAESGQPETLQAGAVYACNPGFGNSLINGCIRLSIEYPDQKEASKPPEFLHSKQLHFEGKNRQMLGFTVCSTGMREEESSRALVCAPLLRWGHNAYTDGVCYLLGSDLNHKGIINTCGPLPKKDRHNDYGSCEQGFSAFIDQNVTITGIPGARKWTGGVFAKYDFVGSGGFIDSVDRRTMEFDKNQGGILALLASHDYLGYSVHYGRFGFWHEDEKNFTIVSGATRFNQTGAVIFLPFRRNFHAEEGPNLGLLDDHFILSGRQLGSGFGSSLAVLDLNNDGFDDLLVGAPFEYFFDEEENEKGGAVYVYFSKGIKQQKGEMSSNFVFYEPIVLRGVKSHSHFGAAIAGIGNINNDPKGFKDFCVGAPHHDSGAVFIFHGNERDHFPTEPSQQIFAKNLINSPKPLNSFGSFIANGIDLDGDGYSELAVGAPESDAVIIFHPKPVLEIKLFHQFDRKHVKISTSRSDWDCALGPS